MACKALSLSNYEYPTLNPKPYRISAKQPRRSKWGKSSTALQSLGAWSFLVCNSLRVRLRVEFVMQLKWWYRSVIYYGLVTYIVVSVAGRDIYLCVVFCVACAQGPAFQASGL